MSACAQVLKGVHGGIREVALKMLLDVKNPQRKLENFTKVEPCHRPCDRDTEGVHPCDNVLLLWMLSAQRCHDKDNMDA